MSSGVVTQSSVANVSSSQSPVVGGAPMQMPMTQACPTQSWQNTFTVCQIIRLDNQKQVILRMEERFGKTSLRAASQLEFNSITQKPEETIEQWGDIVMDLAQKAFGSGTLPEIFQEQLIMRFALGCLDCEANQQLID
uniref:Uncharacterized protein n=1 Tax=Magallana gigas TaxID=29159 RepID=A0A8W8IGQ1_MAGGI